MVVNIDEVRIIFDSLNIKVQSITQVKTLSNFLVKAATNDGNYFLKIYDNKREAKTGYKLAHLYPFLLKNDIPVPEVVKFDDSLKFVKHPYLIITEVKGEMLCEVIDRMDKKEKTSFFYEFGKMIAKIHSITFDKFGETVDGKTVESFSEANHKGPFKSWKEMHKEIINYRLSIFKGTYFEDLIGSIKSWFEKNTPLIDYDIVPRLLHIDLNQKNIFLRNNMMSGIIDFDGAFVGHNEEELMRTEGASFSHNQDLKDSFFKGYTELIGLDNNYDKRRTFYYLSRLLVHTDCVIEYGNNYVKNVEKEQESIRNKINKVLNGEPFDRNKRNTV